MSLDEVSIRIHNDEPLRWYSCMKGLISKLLEPALLPEPALHVYLHASFYIFCTAGHLKTHSFWATGSTNSQCHSEWDHSATLLTFCDIRLHLYPHPLGQWRLVIHRVGWELVAFVSDQVAPLHSLPPSLLLLSLSSLSLSLSSVLHPPPAGCLTDWGYSCAGCTHCRRPALERLLAPRPKTMVFITWESEIILFWLQQE